jgi:uncharacterized protein YdaU (DUF1376 family)
LGKEEQPPAFQFYPREFLSSQAVELMEPAALGGYIRLLCHAWISENPGHLPDDDQAMAGLSRLYGQWTQYRDQIARAFTVSGGEWVQERMVIAREQQIAFRKSMSDNGKIGAGKRWGGHSQAIATPMAKHSSSSSSSTAIKRLDSKTVAKATVKKTDTPLGETALERIEREMEEVESQEKVPSEELAKMISEGLNGVRE